MYRQCLGQLLSVVASTGKGPERVKRTGRGRDQGVVGKVSPLVIADEILPHDQLERQCDGAWEGRKRTYSYRLRARAAAAAVVAATPWSLLASWTAIGVATVAATATAATNWSVTAASGH